MLVFWIALWYNLSMENIDKNTQTNTTKNTNNMNETVTISRAEYEKLKGLESKVDELTRMNEWFLEQIKLLNKSKYSSKKDSVSEETHDQLSLLFDEAETIDWIEKATEEIEVSVAPHTRKRKSRSLVDVVPKDIPVEIEEHRLSSEELNCEICGSEMVEIGKTVRKTLKFIPSQVIVHEDWYYTYACKTCEKESDEAQIIKTVKDKSVLPGSYASAEAVAHIMTQKYVMGVPLYRQEQELKRKQINLSRQTMSNWVIESSERWLMPIYEELHKKLLKEDIIHADETELQVLHEPGKKAQSTSFMWLYRTGKYAENPIVLYDYKDNRRQENSAMFLKGFNGYLQTDGYTGYNTVENVVRVGCLAHLRRKFTDAEKASPNGKASPTVATAIAYCNKLFAIEKELVDLPPQERFRQRKIKAEPLIAEFSSWAKTRMASQKSKLGIALTYLNNQLPVIQNYLLDGRLECSNNLAERSIKPFVIDRKNFLFANTPKGAKNSAVTFSLIETAKAAGIDPYKYLVYIFKTAPTLSTTDENWANKLLPENFKTAYLYIHDKTVT